MIPSSLQVQYNPWNTMGNLVAHMYTEMNMSFSVTDSNCLAQY